MSANNNTIIGIGHFDLPIILTCLGFIAASVLFIKRKIYAFLLPIIVISLIYLIVYPQSLPKTFIQMPDFSLFMQINIFAALSLAFCLLFYHCLLLISLMQLRQLWDC